VNVLVIDIGGTHVKILATGQDEPRKFVSGPTLTPQQMAAGVKKLARGWKYDVTSMGYPGLVLHGRVVAEPHNLGRGWVHFDYRAAFGRPVRMINDAAMQALGSYKGGKMLFLGLGTGLGSALIVDGIVEPMELGHLPYRKSTYEVRRAGRPGEAGKEEVAAPRRGCGGQPDRGPRARRCRARGRERREAEGAPHRLPGRRQRQCIRGRVPPLGGSSRAQDSRPAETGPQPHCDEATQG
jgi:hypothetical protein